MPDSTLFINDLVDHVVVHLTQGNAPDIGDDIELQAFFAAFLNARRRPVLYKDPYLNHEKAILNQVKTLWIPVSNCHEDDREAKQYPSDNLKDNMSWVLVH